MNDATPMSRTSGALLAMLAAVSLAAAGTGRAQPPSHPRPQQQGSSLAPVESHPPAFGAQLPQRRSLSLAEAIMIAQSRHPGRVVRAQTIEQGNGAVHEI